MNVFMCVEEQLRGLLSLYNAFKLFVAYDKQCHSSVE